MSRERASDVGFCMVDSNADLIAQGLVKRVRDAAAEMESDVNRLYRGRNAVDLDDLSRLEIERTIDRLTYLTETLRAVQRAQEPAPALRPYLQAAE